MEVDFRVSFPLVSHLAVGCFIQNRIADITVEILGLLGGVFADKVFKHCFVNLDRLFAVNLLSADYNIRYLLLCEYRIQQFCFAAAVGQAVLHIAECPAVRIAGRLTAKLIYLAAGGLCVLRNGEALCLLRNGNSEPVTDCIRVGGAYAADRFDRLVGDLTEIFRCGGCG